MGYQCAENLVKIFGEGDDEDSNDRASGDSSGALNQSQKEINTPFFCPQKNVRLLSCKQRIDGAEQAVSERKTPEE